MSRQRVDGTKFETELERAVGRAPFPAYYIRLRTPQSMLANVRNIADFLILGRNITILEVKETKEKSFSLNTFQQKEEIEKFKPFFEKAKEEYKFSELPFYPYRVAVLVHFIKQGKFTLYYVDENPFIVMHADDKECITLDKLEEMISFIVRGSNDS